MVSGCACNTLFARLREPIVREIFPCPLALQIRHTVIGIFADFENDEGVEDRWNRTKATHLSVHLVEENELAAAARLVATGKLKERDDIAAVLQKVVMYRNPRALRAKDVV